jgi:hypothetical protein
LHPPRVRLSWTLTTVSPPWVKRRRSDDVRSISPAAAQALVQSRSLYPAQTASTGRRAAALGKTRKDLAGADLVEMRDIGGIADRCREHIG